MARGIEKMRGYLKRLGFVLCVATAAMCVVLHVATFFTIVPPIWSLLPVPFMFGTIACFKAIESGPGFRMLSRKWGLLACTLFVYAVLTFVYFYRVTGGASSVSIVDGQYVSMSKSEVIRTITEHEYRMFPNLWTRVMSAWIGAMAAIAMMSFAPTPDDRLDPTAR